MNKSPDIIEKLPYKCGKLPNSIVINANEVSWTFWKYIRMNNPLEKFDSLLYKFGNLPNSNVMDGNFVITIDQAYAYHGELTV